ncbi:DUF4097 family beta strand repeat protein [Halobacillus kuroshimensis]|uniref:DUF4097 family beta strand repeat protein n=1 Tax=Halobacillus kuroshimensis TaxID=302481 RepID=A0ABS3E0N2_9BACI|nr:DUF4097 family beta strand repeat-containing protein [Halobacillus kuroshimensis]MBN8237163.1 DUF4097 family beta strand repeat protein [Halobacillus kuroshimensis]
MKKIWTGICLVLLVLLSGVVLYSLWGSQEVKAVTEYEKQEVERIEIEVASMDVDIQTASVSDIEMSAEGKTDQPLFTYHYSEGTLHLEEEERKGIRLLPFSPFKDASLSIVLPKKKYEGLTMQASSGDIRIEGLTAETIHIEASSGSVDMVDTEIQKTLAVETSSGDVTGEAVTAGARTYKTKSGSIREEDADGGKTTVDTTSGDLSLSGMQVLNGLEVETNSGDVHVSYALAAPQDGKVLFTSRSGDAVVNWEDLLYETKKEHSFEAVLGDGTEENIIRIATQSGDLHLENR